MNAPNLPSETERIDAALIREAVRVQKARTLLDVRRLVDGIPIDKPGRSYGRDNRTAKEFRTDLVDGLMALDGAR